MAEELYNGWNDIGRPPEGEKLLCILPYKNSNGSSVYRNEVLETDSVGWDIITLKTRTGTFPLNHFIPLCKVGDKLIAIRDEMDGIKKGDTVIVLRMFDSPDNSARCFKFKPDGEWHDSDNFRPYTSKLHNSLLSGPRVLWDARGDVEWKDFPSFPSTSLLKPGEDKVCIVRGNLIGQIGTITYLDATTGMPAMYPFKADTKYHKGIWLMKNEVIPVGDFALRLKFDRTIQGGFKTCTINIQAAEAAYDECLRSAELIKQPSHQKDNSSSIFSSIKTNENGTERSSVIEVQRPDIVVGRAERPTTSPISRGRGEIRIGRAHFGD